jgi:hypothetical protein
MDVVASHTLNIAIVKLDAIAKTIRCIRRAEIDILEVRSGVWH